MGTRSRSRRAGRAGIPRFTTPSARPGRPVEVPGGEVALGATPADSFAVPARADGRWEASAGSVGGRDGDGLRPGSLDGADGAETAFVVDGASPPPEVTDRTHKRYPKAATAKAAVPPERSQSRRTRDG